MIAGLQFLIPATAPPVDVAGLAPRRARPVAPPIAPEYPAILAAPLFAPDRRPSDPADPHLSGAGGGLSGYAALGAAIGRGVATAVVSAPGGQARTLRGGDDLDGWRLVEVTRARLTFERNGVRRALIVGMPAEQPVVEAPAQAANP